MQGATVPIIILSFFVLILVSIIIINIKMKGDGVMGNRKSEFRIIILNSLSIIFTDLTGGALLT